MAGAGGFVITSGAGSGSRDGMGVGADAGAGLRAGVGRGAIVLVDLGFVLALALPFVRGLLGTITTWPETNFIAITRLITHKVITTVAANLRLSSFDLYIFLSDLHARGAKIRIGKKRATTDEHG